MKILEVCTESSPTYALVFQRAQTLNQQYPRLFQIDILCSEGKEVSLMQQQGMKVIISCLHRSLSPLALLRSLFNLHQVLRRNEYQVIHLHFGIPGLVGRLLATLYRQPIWVYQSHGYSISANTGKLSRTLYLAVERAFKNTVDFALFQSKEDIRLARQYRLLHQAQIIYLGNGIDTDRFQPDSAKMPDNDDAHKNCFVFGMVARFESIKNHQLLLDAIKRLRLKTENFKVLLIGQGELKDKIAAQIAAHELYQWVEIMSYNHDMPGFYRQIDMGVLTSFGEGLPRALLEPMACGKPVLCTDVKGSREAVVDNETGFILPLDQPAVWAEKMLWCIEHQHTLRTMGHQARQHVLEHFSEQQVIERLDAVYQRCYQLNEDKKATAFTESST